VRSISFEKIEPLRKKRPTIKCQAVNARNN